MSRDEARDERPEGWARHTLGELLAIRLMNGRSVPTAESGFPVLRLTALHGGAVDLKERKFGAWTREQAERYLVEQGDFLVARGNGSIELVGRGSIVGAPPDEVAFPDTMIRVRPDQCRLRTRLLRWQWDAPHVRAQIERAAKTTAGIFKVNQKDLEAVGLVVPPIEQQDALADEIENQFTRLDAAVSTLNRVEAKLDAARASVLQAAVEGCLVPTEAEVARAEGRSYEPATALLERTLDERRRRWAEENPGKKYKPPVKPDVDDLPELPEGWTWASVDQLVREELRNGRSVKSADGGFPVLRLTALEGGRLRLQERKSGAWTLEEADPYLVEQGDFFIARGNGSIERVGAGALLLDQPDQVAFPDTMIRLRFSEHLVLQYAALCWSSPLLRGQIERSARTTAGIFKVNQRLVARYALPVPPEAEQHRIVAEVDRRLSVMDALKANVRMNLARCNRLRQAILKCAFEGRLVPAVVRGQDGPAALPMHVASSLEAQP